MTYYGNIFVSSRKFYSRTRGERGAHAGALFFVGLSQLLLSLVGLKLLDKLAVIDLRGWLENRYAFATVLIGWFIVVSMYYTLARVASIEQAFEAKTEAQQNVWGWVALGSFIIPAAALYFIFP